MCAVGIVVQESYVCHTLALPDAAHFFFLFTNEPGECKEAEAIRWGLLKWGF